MATVALIMLGRYPVHAEESSGHLSPFRSDLGIRGAALGGCYVSLVGESDIARWNPAGLFTISRFSFSAGHSRLFAGTRINSASIGGNWEGIGGVGLAIERLGTDEFAGVRDWSPTGEIIDYGTSRLTLAYGREFTPGGGLGLSLHTLQESFAGQNDIGVGVDIGAMWRKEGQYALGVVWRDMLAPRVRLGSIAESYNRSFALGASIAPHLIEKNVTLGGAVEFEILAGDDPRAHFGLEATFLSALAARVGLNNSRPTLGVGIERRGARFDYSFEIVDHLDDIHRIGVAMLFGPTVAERRSAREARDTRRGLQMAATARRAEERAAFDRAEKFAADNQLDSALVYYKLSAALSDTTEPNDELKRKIASASSRITIARHDELNAAMTTGASQISRQRMMVDIRKSLAEGNWGQASSLAAALSTAYPDEAEAQEFVDTVLARSEVARYSLKSEFTRSLAVSNFVTAGEALSSLRQHFPADSSLTANADKLNRLMRAREALFAAYDFQFIGQTDSARHYAKLALTLHPEYAKASRFLQKLKARSSDDSAAGLDEIAANPKDWTAFSLALDMNRRGEYANALVIVKKLLLRYPANQELLRNKRQIELRINPSK